MKVLVTGACGQLGYEVVRVLVQRGIDVIGTDICERWDDNVPYIQIDLTSKEIVQQALLSIKPDAVIHCAAWTAVDLAEDAEKRSLVYAINAHATGYLAKACRDVNAKMLYVSTDYVFNGMGEEPWKSECSRFAPVNVYGQSKLAGEEAVRQTLERFFIVRTAWVFGPRGQNFVRTMLRLAETHDSLRIVNDQIGTPTYAPDLARLLADMIVTEQYGVYHATNEGEYISWYQFACEIFRQAGVNVHVQPVSTAEYGQSKAQRPFNSRLDRSKLAEQGFEPLPDWHDALARYLCDFKDINS